MFDQRYQVTPILTNQLTNYQLNLIDNKRTPQALSGLRKCHNHRVATGIMKCAKIIKTQEVF